MLGSKTVWGAARGRTTWMDSDGEQRTQEVTQMRGTFGSPLREGRSPLSSLSPGPELCGVSTQLTNEQPLR